MIFNKGQKRKKSSKMDPLTKEELEQIVGYEIQRACVFMDSNITGPRQLAEKYYQGETRLKVEEGSSSVVVTKVRDTIKSVVPSIARVFTQSDVICEFGSEDEEDQKIIKDSTVYCNNVFHKFGGFTALIHASIDSMKARVGVVRVDVVKKQIATHDSTQIMSQEEIDDISENEESDVQVTEIGDQAGVDEETGLPLYQVSTTRNVYRKIWDIKCYPPEEFFVDEEATCTDDARIHGFRSNKYVHEVVSMGVALEELEGVTFDDTSQMDIEKFNRLGYMIERDGAHPKDLRAKEVLVCEVYFRVDADGDGIAELRRIVTVGNNYKVVLDEAVDFTNIAVFRTDLYPHMFFPISMAEDVMQDQDAMTAILRSIINNAALVNTPRTEVNENIVNMDDVKSNEVGAIIRVKAMGGINELSTPFVAGQTLPVYEALNDLCEARTGVTKLSQGVDADALQSTSRVAANGIAMAADARIEMMCRSIGETGVKDMFNIILKTAIREFKEEQSVQTPQGYSVVNPSEWHDQLSITPAVGMGNGRIDEKVQMLMTLSEQVMQVISKLGMSNPVAGYNQLRAVLKTAMRLSGIRNYGEYLPYVPDEVLKQLDQQAQQAAQGPQAPDPTQGLVEAEKVKGQVKMQVESAKGQISAALKTQQMKMEDDRLRDKQDQDYAVAAFKASLDAKTKAEVAKKTETPRTVQ